MSSASCCLLAMPFLLRARSRRLHHHQLPAQRPDRPRFARVGRDLGRLMLRNDSKSRRRTRRCRSRRRWVGMTSAPTTSRSTAIASPTEAQLQWLGETYTSDIDHTGGLSEAIVTLGKKSRPVGASRLMCSTAERSRPIRPASPAWALPQIGAAERLGPDQRAFTAIRGLGYVVWYPVRSSCQHE